MLVSVTDDVEKILELSLLKEEQARSRLVPSPGHNEKLDRLFLDVLWIIRIVLVVERDWVRVGWWKQVN